MLQKLKTIFRHFFPRPEQALLMELKKHRLETVARDVQLPSGRVMKGLKPMEAYNEYKDMFIKGIYDVPLEGDAPRIIDAGAYVGFSAVYFLERYPHCDLTLFECDPDIVEQLKANVPEVAQGRVKLEECALSSNSGHVTFYKSGDDAGSIHVQTEQAFEVKCEPLAPYLEKGEVDFLKMNIEGAEMDVLEACGEKLRAIKEMVIEFHSFAGQSQRLQDLLGTLSRQGYRYAINHFDEDSNWACRTPFRIQRDTSFVLLVHAIRDDVLEERS